MTNFTLHTLDLPAFVNQIHRHAIGFDGIFEELNRTFANSKTDGNYPPYNLIKLTDNQFVIEVAVAGFDQNEIDVELKENVLTVKGEQSKKETEIEYQHKGISTRNFTRQFPLAEHARSTSSESRPGMYSLRM
jgi:molecular chaperone IbpA